MPFKEGVKIYKESIEKLLNDTHHDYYFHL